MVDAARTGKLFVKTQHHDTYPAIDPTQWVPSGEYKGRVVLITGASRGLGRAMALSFARAGVSGLVLTARSMAALDAVEAELHTVHPSKDLKVLKVPLDIRDEQAVSNAVVAVRDTFGRLDVLVNNAAIMESFVPIVDSQPSVWWTTWETNVKGPYLITRAFLGLLLGSGCDPVGQERGLEGRKIVVNLTSIGANLMTVGLSAYQMSKLAVLRFTEFLATEYGAQGILPIALEPGCIATDLGASIPAEYHFVLVDTPELSADTLVWLARDRKEWLSGRMLIANWDIEELELKKDEIVDGDKLKVRLVV